MYIYTYTYNISCQTALIHVVCGLHIVLMFVCSTASNITYCQCIIAHVLFSTGSYVHEHQHYLNLIGSFIELHATMNVGIGTTGLLSPLPSPTITSLVISQLITRTLPLSYLLILLIMGSCLLTS